MVTYLDKHKRRESKVRVTAGRGKNFHNVSAVAIISDYKYFEYYK